LTTIAYRDGILAADSLVTSDGIRTSTIVKLARREKDGTLFGACGRASLIRAAREWFLRGEPPEDRIKIKDNEAQFIIVRPNNDVETWDESGSSDDAAPFHALGSGRDIALGAMAAGASAIEAVRIAAKFDTGTGGPIRHVARKAR
jgi:hypothetical protein